MTLNDARTLFSRTVHEVRLGTLDAAGVREARAQLVAIRDRLNGRARQQVELYLSMLDDDWIEPPPTAPRPGVSDGARETQQLVLDAFERHSRCLLRLAEAIGTLERIAELSREAADRAERMTIAELCEPLVLLISRLERELPAGAVR